MTSKAELVKVKKENAVISCILTNPDLIYDDDLKPSEFHNPLARDIFTVIQSIAKAAEESKKDIDFSPVNLEERGKAMGINVKSDDIRDLKSCTSSDGSVSVNSFGAYVQDIKDVNLRIRLFEAAEQAQNFASDEKTPADEAIAKSENLFISIEDEAKNVSEPIQIEAGGEEQLEQYKNAAETGFGAGLHTGFKSYDEATGGLRPGSLSVFAARAKTGKSLIALNMAWNMFQEYGAEVPMLYLDTEMPTWQVRLRLWAIASGVNARNIEEGRLNPKEEQLVEKARQETAKMPLYHLYMPSFSAETLVRVSRKMKNKKGIECMFFDYIKLPDETSLKNQQEWQSLGFMTNALKNRIAGHLEIPTVSFAQLNRSGITQAQQGEPDEGSVGAADRINQYCSALSIMRKANDDEINARFDENAPWYKRFGNMANRFLHIKLTRDGGDDSDPIPMHLDGNSLQIRESGEIVLDGDNEPLSKKISRQIASQNPKEAGSD